MLRKYLMTKCHPEGGRNQPTVGILYFCLGIATVASLPRNDIRYLILLKLYSISLMAKPTATANLAPTRSKIGLRSVGKTTRLKGSPITTLTLKMLAR